MSTIDLKPITLAIALADPDPLFGGPLLVGATCRSCGVAFFDTGDKRLCDTCLVERVNGAGEQEDDDPDNAINQVPRWASRDARDLVDRPRLLARRGADRVQGLARAAGADMCGQGL